MADETSDVQYGIVEQSKSILISGDEHPIEWGINPKQVCFFHRWHHTVSIQFVGGGEPVDFTFTKFSEDDWDKLLNWLGGDGEPGTLES